MEHDLIWWLTLSLLALAAGSFFNLVIYRLPLMILHPEIKLNLASPRSHCPHCKTLLTRRDLIPLFSWLILRGRCRYCAVRISYRYPAMELLSLLTALLVAVLSHAHEQMIFTTLLFGWTLLVLTIIDIDHHLLPDILTLSLLWAGLLRVALAGQTLSPADAIVGAVAGYLLLRLPSDIWYCWRKEVALGGGDIKLFAALGAWLGAKALPIALIIASAGALIFLLAKAGICRKPPPRRFAFGPWLSLGGMMVFVWQNYY
ncbi:general secretion pathway protein O/leader peptidase (prepilin peptidase) / N-methyltransferase [Izhakiella capsodis]|uniref:Prepilin leader peptidase/N-methyltransferase n=1 Tax=Izhakiella capsodis TaxID=1367852 RepID=A0A1I4WAY4_9GAMM|nr:A24 family peptidase [Izhakiella capsodis]SFN10585.1 general secretion pathway protein O/leader peptidase (prepilin peptidase) / N-methyltransferase [Izhakiella capsodis]